MGEAKQMPYLVEQSHGAIQSKPYCVAGEPLTAKTEVEVAKHLAKHSLEKFGKNEGGTGGSASSKYLP